MIANVTHGRNPVQLLRYVAEKEGAYLIDTNLVSDNYVDMGRELRLAQQLHSSINVYVWHTSLSVSKEEKLTDDDWKKIGRAYLNKMEFGKNQYVMFRHTDADHHHIHVVANRISALDGQAVPDSWSKYRTEKVIREIEREFGLRQTPSSAKRERKSPKTGEIRKQRRDGKTPIRVRLQDEIDLVLPTAKSPENLKGLLEAKGVTVRFRKGKTGDIIGVSFGLEGVGFSGSKLGTIYSWTQLEKQLRENRETSNTDKRNQLRTIYQQRLAGTPDNLTDRERDTLVAAKLLKENCDQPSIMAVLTQSPSIKKNNDPSERERAIQYINEIVKNASELTNSQEVMR